MANPLTFKIIVPKNSAFRKRNRLGCPLPPASVAPMILAAILGAARPESDSNNLPVVCRQRFD
jgi:hypothetical protein